MKPRGIAGELADQVFPCIDVAWKENVNLPRLQMPVDRWPDCPSARVQAWFRFSEPLAATRATIRKDDAGQTLSVASEKWIVEQTGGEAGVPRKVTVIWQPSEPRMGIDKLLDYGAWLSPAPDETRRQYAIDGSAAIHEFTYSRAEAATLELRIVSRAQFQQGAYFAECEFEIAN